MLIKTSGARPEGFDLDIQIFGTVLCARHGRSVIIIFFYFN